MKKILFYTFLFSTSLFLSSCSDNNTITESNSEGVDNISLYKGSGPSANGSAIITVDGQKEILSFHAREKNGVVSGSIQVNARNLPDGKAHGVINCMIIDGNVATLCGEFTDDGLDIGDGGIYPYFVIMVQDNGEGNNNPADQYISFVLPNEELTCDFFSDFNDESNTYGLRLEIEKGNVQVKP